MRRHRFLALAIVLFVAAAILLSFGEREPQAAERREIAFPEAPREAELERMEARATLALPAPRPPVAATADGTGPEEPVRRDPFLAALPARPEDPVVVLEANALRHSRLGELFVGCLLARDPDTFARIERETGIDPLKDVDRVAFVGDTLVVSGFFDRARWSELGAQGGGRGERYGADGQIYGQERGRSAFGVWRDQLVVIDEDPARIRRALDQLEGRAAVPETGLPEELAYGEVYGVVPGVAVERLLGRGDAALGARLAAAASRIELHVDAMQDVAAVVRVHGDDEAGLRDLGRSMGAALAVARLQAQATGDHALADLLEVARVVPADGHFSLELALPAARLEEWFAGCERRPRAIPPAEEAGGSE